MVKKVKQKLNVGFVTIWFERGQAYVTKAIHDVVAEKHSTFIFARMGQVGTQRGILKFQETKGFWEVPNITAYDQYDISHEVFERWLVNNKIDAVVFNEEYDWSLVELCKSKGVKTVTYLDFYKDDWKPRLETYDAILCSTHRTYDLIKDLKNAHYIGWGVDTELFKPRKYKNKYTFFHNAGWLGINFRKMTPAVIVAFDAISRENPDISLLIHSQQGLDHLPPDIANIAQANPRITYYVGTVPAPGLYHKGLIYVYPAKLDGLGLSLLEALSCGLPAITTDAPPMNEFVKEGYNGALVKVAEFITRHDNISFPEAIIDLNDLCNQMYEISSDAKKIKNMAKKAREEVLADLTWENNRNKVLNAIEG